jgi:hypothetical protein
MRRCIWLALGLALVMATALPSLAAVATIETTAPLWDHRDESVNAALHAALQAAVVGAAAMGLPWIRISRALILEDAVAVKIFATDEDPATDTDDEGPGLDSESSVDVF